MYKPKFGIIVFLSFCPINSYAMNISDDACSNTESEILQIHKVTNDRIRKGEIGPEEGYKAAFREEDLILSKAEGSCRLNAFIQYRSGYREMRAGNLNSAESYFEKVVEINPKHSEAFNFLANIKFTKGNSEAGYSFLFKAVQSGKNIQNAISELCSKLYQDKRYIEAINYCTIALEKGHSLNIPYAYAYRASSFYHLGKIDKAKEDIGLGDEKDGLTSEFMNTVLGVKVQ